MRVRIKIKRRKKTGAPWGRSSNYWLAMGTLAAYSAAGGKTALPLVAQQDSGGAKAPYSKGQSGSPAGLRFDVPAGSLDDALTAFENASGLQVSTPDGKVRTVNSPGVSGMFTPRQALEKLLAGTGVEFRFTSERTVIVELGPSTSVNVTDLTPQVSSVKYTEPLRDTPQTITIIPKAVIEQQGATSLRDVLRNVPGLTMTAGEGGTPSGDNLTLRGFSARNDLFVDGVRDLGPQSRDPFNLEQVEVVKGPALMVSGRGSAGGTINLVSKTPGLRPVVGFGVAFGSDATKRISGDVNTPVKFLGERTAFRANMLFHEGGVAGRDVVRNQRWGLAPSLAFGLGTPTRLTLSYFHMSQDNLPDYGIPWVTATQNVLSQYRDQGSVPRNTYYGLKSRDKESMGSGMGTVKIEHDFSDSVSLRNQFRYGKSDRDSITAAPRFASNDSLAINRNGPSWITEDTILDNQTDLRANFRTGRISHSLVTGLNLTRENNIRKGRTVAGAPTTTLYNPDPDQPFNGTITYSPFIGDITGNSQAVYAFDTAKFGRHFEATGGLRWERFDVDGVNTTPAPVVRTDTMRSVRGALIYKPAQSGSLYVSYGTSLSPSLEGLSYSTFNAAIPPEKTSTIEAGAKWDVAHDKLLLTAAVFRVDKDNARTPGVLPDDPPQVLQGTQRVKGFELGATGNITRNWQLFGGYTYMDPTIAKSNTPAEVGKTFQNTPRNSLNAWSAYRYKKLTFGGGPRFVGKRFGNNTNTRVVGNYWTVDGMASYPVARRIDMRLNLFNLNNAYYFDRLGGGHLIPGAARSVMVSANFRF